MGGPSTHGQKNKAHKAGRNAGKSAREKHRAKKEAGGPHRQGIKATSAATKAERALHSKQQRDAKRQQALERRRREGAPLVVALLPLSDEADAPALWRRLIEACSGGSQQQQQQQGGGGGDAAMADADAAAAAVDISNPDALAAALGLRPHTAVVQSRTRLRATLLPPPRDRADPMAAVELGRAADVLLLVIPGDERAAAVDAEGALALGILRAMGLPYCAGVVLCSGGNTGAGGGGGGGMKERSAAKKRAEKALAPHLPGGEVKVFHGDSAADAQQLVRHLSDAPPRPPLWRRGRAAVVVQEAAFSLDAADPAAAAAGEQAAAPSGTLRLTGYVRSAGLSANQLVTVPGAGDFALLAIEGPPDPAAPARAARRGGAAGDDEMADAAGGAAGAAARVLAEPDPERRDEMVRENRPDPLLGEQTWPTDEELRDAELAATAAAAAAARRRRKLPPGTSDYQAAWILDDMSGGESDLGDSEDLEAAEDLEADPQAGPEAMGEDVAGGGGAGGSGGGGGGGLRFDEEGGGEDLDHLGDDLGSDGMLLGMSEDDDDEDDGAARARMRAAREEMRRQRQAEAEDVDYPDEVDVPDDRPARERFARYRGLKSLRSSPWDPREGTPAEYERVFAFENFKRTHKKAKEAAARATAGTDPCAVPPGSYVTLVLAAVPAPAASGVLQRVAAFAAGAVPPLTAFGLMQHEAKLSVVNFSLKKAAGYAESVRNKEELLFVTGLRGFVARPVLSGDDHRADKHKMERFLHAGRQAVASVYAPISYGPLPLLAFKCAPGRRPVLAATGSLRSVDPDRVVLKKIVLTGYPARVHKSKAVVRFMFHNPDDVRWFKPVELWTKSGRRGRITEALGTHGAFKARFDGPVQQRDSVCLSLYKRAFPKWPEDTAAFAVA